MKKLLNWFIDKWLAGFTTATIFFISKIYYDLPKDKKANFFHFEWVTSIINYPIKLWKVFLIILFLLLMFVVSRWRIKQKQMYRPKQKKLPNDPAFSYTIDTFGVNNAKWTWTYDHRDYDNTILVKDVTPVCPVCDNKMEIDNMFSSRNSATCSKCRLDGKNYYHQLRQNEYDVQQEIIRRLKSGEHPKNGLSK